jgi:predicted phosphodiesterase
VVRIGVISDTHGLMRPEVEQRLAGVAHIVHVGDIGSPNVIAGLQRDCAYHCDQRERRYRPLGGAIPE